VNAWHGPCFLPLKRGTRRCFGSFSNLLTLGCRRQQLLAAPPAAASAAPVGLEQLPGACAPGPPLQEEYESLEEQLYSSGARSVELDYVSSREPRVAGCVEGFRRQPAARAAAQGPEGACAVRRCPMAGRSSGP
jgi:hypothetical protein